MATHQRAPTIEPEWKERFYAYIGGAIKGLGATPLAIGGVADHVHLLVGLKPSHCLSDFIREVKKASSIWVHKEIGRPQFAWQEGYAAFSVGADALRAVRAYIGSQEEHHRKRGSKEELLELCKEFGIEVDLRFFE